MDACLCILLLCAPICVWVWAYKCVYLGSVAMPFYLYSNLQTDHLTHWCRVTHICIGNIIIIGCDNGLSPGGRQAIMWTNDGILLIGTLGINFSEIRIGILTFSFVWKCRLRNGGHFISASMCWDLVQWTLCRFAPAFHGGLYVSSTFTKVGVSTHVICFVWCCAFCRVPSKL